MPNLPNSSFIEAGAGLDGVELLQLDAGELTFVCRSKHFVRYSVGELLPDMNMSDGNVFLNSSIISRGRQHDGGTRFSQSL